MSIPSSPSLPPTAPNVPDVPALVPGQQSRSVSPEPGAQPATGTGPRGERSLVRLLPAHQQPTALLLQKRQQRAVTRTKALPQANGAGSGQSRFELLPTELLLLIVSFLRKTPKDVTALR